MRSFRDELIAMNADRDAVEWVGNRDLQTFWDECPRAPWMLSLLKKMVGQSGWPSDSVRIHCGCDCAETALPFVRAGEDRPRLAIEAGRRYADNMTNDNRKIARSAAFAAEVASNSATSAAEAAACSAARSAAATAASLAASSAANAAADFAADVADLTACSRAYTAVHIRMCGLIRDRVPIPYNAQSGEKP